MAPKRHASPPPWARKHTTTDSGASSMSTSKVRTPSQKDDELDKAVKELVKWWRDDLVDEEYYPRIQKLVDACHARPPGYEQCKKFETMFLSAGATQEHVNTVLEDLEPHWTQAILTHVARTASSSHGVASVIRIILAETERIHGPVIDKTFHDDLIRVVNRFDHPPPILPVLSGPQRPQPQVDDDTSKTNPEEILVSPTSPVDSVSILVSPTSPDDSVSILESPTSPVDSVIQRQLPAERPTTASDIQPSYPTLETLRLSGMKLHYPHLSRRFDNKGGSSEMHKENEKGRDDKNERGTDAEGEEERGRDRVGRDKPPPDLSRVPDGSKLDREGDAAEASRARDTGEQRAKRKFDFDEEDSREGRAPPTSRRSSEQEPASRHQAKIHLPFPTTTDKSPPHIQNEILEAAQESKIPVDDARLLGNKIWILDFNSETAMKVSIGRTLVLRKQPVVIQPITGNSNKRQIFVAHVPSRMVADDKALLSIAKTFSSSNFSLLLEDDERHRKLLKCIVCLETPIDKDYVRTFSAFHGLLPDTERCFVCKAPHCSLRCNRTRHYAKEFLKQCPQYLPYVPEFISQD